MIVLLIILFLFIIYLIISTYIDFTITNNNFKEYLLSIEDEKTSQWIGLWFRPIIEIEMMMEKKYEQTNNEKYLQFGDKYRELVIRMRILGVLLFVLLTIYVIVTN
jgi:hypothetical protein